MKKVVLLSLLGLTACQAPSSRLVYEAIGPTNCVEYADAFICSSPQQVWHETVYPKNNRQMTGGHNIFVTPSLSQTVYGTY